MSDSGGWQPPKPEVTPSPPPPPFRGPEVPLDEVETTTPPRRRSHGAVIAAGVGAAVVLGAAVFGAVQLVGGDDKGGAATPDEAGLALLTALENEDVLGMIDILLPGERETLRDPATELTEELRRLGVLSDEADLGAISGVDVVLDDESVRATPTHVDDIVNLEIAATGSATVDGEQLPIGDLILDNTDVDLAELDADSSDDGGVDDLTLQVTAVEDGGRWYLSLFHSVAETIRAEADESVEIPVEGITPIGGDSPEDALDAFLDGVEQLDLETVIATLNPDEFQALQRYAPTFLDDAQEELDRVVAEAGVEVEIADPEYTVSGRGDTRSMSIDYFRVDVTSDEEAATIELEDGCWTVTTAGDEVNSCELAEDTPTLEDVFEDAESVQVLVTTLEEAFADYENPGFIVEQVDGQWFLSPFATGSEQLLAALRALDREELDEIIEQAQGAFEEALDEGLFDPTSEESGGAVPITPPETTQAHDSSVPTTVDPSGICFTEPTGEEAGACFRELIDAGQIEPSVAPVYVLYPECGLAEVYWSGDYSSLPDADFVAIVEETAPCFQDLVRSGELTEADLPLELSHPACLDGRNWFRAIEDQAYYEEVFDCAYG